MLQKTNNLMKLIKLFKTLSVLITLCFIIAITLFTVTNTYSAEDQLLMENVAALAGDPPVTWIDDADPRDCYMTIETTHLPDEDHLFCATCTHIPNSRATKNSTMGKCG